MTTDIAGIPIVLDEDMMLPKRVQYRWPRSKRKRIRKKWAKKYRRTEMLPAIMIIGHMAVGSHRAIAILRNVS